MAAKNENSVPDAEHRPLLLPVLRTALVMCSFIVLASTYFSIAVNSLSMGLMTALWLGIMVVERRWGAARTASCAVNDVEVDSVYGQVTTLLLRSRLDDKSSTNFGRS